MSSANRVQWMLDVRESDILLLQENLKLLLAVFGISQPNAGKLFGMSGTTINDYTKSTKVMSVARYIRLRMYMQTHVQTTLQKEALFYCTHRAQNAKIVQEKIEAMNKLMRTFRRRPPETTREYAAELSQLWLQFGRKKEA